MSDDVSGHQDPEGSAPWAMQVVVRLEKDHTLTNSLVVAAVARATVLFLTSEEATSGSFAPLVERWMEGRIRKVVRRARASSWERALEVPGLTFVHEGVSVHVAAPGPTDAVLPQLRKLQVSGMDLPGEYPLVPSGPGLVVALTPDVEMSPGKASAQAGHAAQLLVMALDASERESFFASGAPLQVVRPSRFLWETWSRLARVSVTDAGFTEVPPGTKTALAFLSQDVPA